MKAVYCLSVGSAVRTMKACCGPHSGPYFSRTEVLA